MYDMLLDNLIIALKYTKVNHGSSYREQKYIDKVLVKMYYILVKNKKGGEIMLKHLTEKDLKEGKELIQILENLPESDMKQVIIYASALKDRQLIESSKKAG